MFFAERQQLTICLIAAVLGGVFLVGRYLPLRRAMSEIRQEKAVRTMEIAQSAADQRQLSVLRHKIEALEADVESYESGITDRRALGVFLSRIASLMNEHGLEDQNVTPGEEITAGKLQCIPVEIKCKGRLVHMFEFFQHLQTLERFVRIEKVELINDESMSGRVNMKTQAVIFHRGKPEPNKS